MRQLSVPSLLQAVLLAVLAAVPCSAVQALQVGEVAGGRQLENPYTTSHSRRLHGSDVPLPFTAVGAVVTGDEVGPLEQAAFRAEAQPLGLIAGARRLLRTGRPPVKLFPPCSICRITRCAVDGGPCFGKCRKGTTLFNCSVERPEFDVPSDSSAKMGSSDGKKKPKTKKNSKKPKTKSKKNSKKSGGKNKSSGKKKSGKKKS